MRSQPSWPAQPVDDEIDLRAYLEVLWRGRWVVAAVTLGAALAALAASQFLVRPVYEASVLLLVEAPRPRADASQPPPPVEAVSLNPVAFKQIVESPPFQALLEEKDAASQEAEGEPPSRVSARVIAQTNLLELTVESADAREAATRANQAAGLLLREAERVNQERMNRALALLEQQIASARANLDEAIGRLQEFTRRGPSVEQLQNEQWSKLNLIASYQQRLAELRVRIATERTALESLTSDLARQPRTVALKKALSPEGAALSQVLQNLGATAGPFLNFEDQQLNPVYVTLQEQMAIRQANLAALEAERNELEQAAERLAAEVQALTSDLVKLRAEQQELTWQAELARRNYEQAVTQLEAQRAALASRLGESTLTLVRPAVAPDRPSRPRPLLNATVAGFLGLMVSVFGLFFAEFWKSPVRTPIAGGEPASAGTHPVGS